MTAQWPVIGFPLYVLFSLLFSVDFLRFFLSAICMAVSPHPVSSLIGPLEFQKACLMPKRQPSLFLSHKPRRMKL